MILPNIPPSKTWKYAKSELERRFLLSNPPNSLSEIPSKTILDKYLENSRLRIRKVTNTQGSIYKLTKKLLLAEDKKQKQWTSTIYLSEEEYETLIILPGEIIAKTRYSLQTDSETIIGIDEIELFKQKLWIAEVEFEDEKEMKQFAFPLAYDREITNEQGFAGNELAARFDQDHT